MSSLVCESIYESVPAVRSRSGLNLALAAVLLACVVRLWLMPLESSFWVDEMGTSFVVRNGADDPSLRIAPQVPESIYYALPEASARLLGGSEAAYRLPSALAMAVALWLIFRLSRRLIHPAAGWFAAFACLALHGFNYQAADARPYALGTCVACVSLWCLVQWLDTARWRDAAVFAVAASVLWRVHLILWPVYAVFALYAIALLVRRETRVSWKQAALVFGLLGLSLIPELLRALVLLREAAAHVVVPPPSVAELANSLKVGLLMTLCGVAAFLSRWLRWPAVEHLPSWKSFTLVGAWWLCPPACLFGFSWFTGNSVFVPRYLFIALPGAALSATVAAAVFIPPGYWKRLALALGIGVFLFLGRWGHFWPEHHNSDWRAAARTLNAQRLGADVPVISPSPFIEARPPVWRPDYPVSSFLYSHLQVYRIGGRIYPFPFDDSPQAEAFAGKLSQQTLTAAHRFVLYGSDQSVRFWRDWFRYRPELAGWHSRRLGPFGDIDVIVFQQSE